MVIYKYTEEKKKSVLENSQLKLTRLKTKQTSKQKKPPPQQQNKRKEKKETGWEINSQADTVHPQLYSGLRAHS